MKLKPLFYNRSGSKSPMYSWLPVISASWAAVGGPEKARLGGFNAGRISMPELVNLLGCAVELQTEDGRAAWWGFVNGFEYWNGPTGAVCSLDGMANKVKARYSSIELTPLSGWMTRPAYTAWASNLASQGVYGVKENLLRLAAQSTTDATGVRDLALVNHAWPEVLPAVREGQAGNYGGNLFVDLRGWWNTAGWRYYAQDAGLIEHLGQNDNPMTCGMYAYVGKSAQSFTVGAVGWRLDTAWIRCRQAGAPGDNLVVNLRADSAGNPGAVLATQAIVGANLTTNYTWTAFTFSSPYTLAANTKYWLEVARSGAYDNDNFYMIILDESLGFAGGGYKIFNDDTDTWAARVPDADLHFRLVGSLETSEQISLMAAASCGGAKFAGLRGVISSGVFANPFRVGDYPARKEIEDLLRAGTSAGLRMLARVTYDKYLEVYAQPADTTAELRVDLTGAICNEFGNRLAPSVEAAGQWAVVDNVWQGHGSGTARVKDRVLLERVEWDPGTGVLRPGGNKV